MEESYLIELYELMTAAWALWNDAIGGTAMSILNVEFSWETCPSEANGYYLRVAKTDQKAAKCSPGWNRGTGGSLEIDTSSDWGTMNSAVNLAHEVRESLKQCTFLADDSRSTAVSLLAGRSRCPFRLLIENLQHLSTVH